VDVVKPRWSSSSFLLYLGAFTILGSMSGAYSYLANEYGSFAFVGWTLLMLAILSLLAGVFRSRRAWLTGGLFAYLTVAAIGTFVGALFDWFGWGDTGGSDPFDGWNWTLWIVAAVVVAASIAALTRDHFPLFVLPICILIWYVGTDVVSGGGSWSAVVTLAFGALYFAVGLAVNRVYGFWVHVVSGGLVAGALLYWWRGSEAGWWAMAVVSVLFVLVGIGVRRSSWAVIGAAGLWASSVYFSVKWTLGNFGAVFGGDYGVKAWIPIVVFAGLGFIYMALGLIAAHRRAIAE
jgi:hypothetical protein